MFVLTILVAVCLVDYTVTADGILDKPVYDLEDAENLFENFVKEHKKNYSPKEYYQRLQIFKNSLKEINDKNARNSLAVFAVNRFADLTVEEKQQYFGFKPLNSTAVNMGIPDVPLAESLDWRAKGVVSPVQDQGQCGSCYIFSAMGNIEGQYAIKHKKCLDLSEGQALDCLDCGSCNGGIMHEVMQEFSKRDGVETEADYPYTPKKGKCHEDKSKVVAHVTSGKEIKIHDENDLQQKLAQIGPLAVALSASDFQHYSHGILEPDDCKNQDVNHGVVLVGYGEENGKKFWIIKNSWGKGWGEHGYVRLLRGVNACKMGTSYTATSTVA